MTEEQHAEPDAEPEGGLPWVIESRTMVVVAYLSAPLSPYLAFVPMVSLLFPNMKRSAWMRYHAWNALLLTAVAGGLYGLLNLVTVPVALSGAAWADAVCAALSLGRYVLVPTAAAVVALHLGYEAYRRRPAHLPVLSDWAHRWAGDETEETEAQATAPPPSPAGSPPAAHSAPRTHPPG